MKIYLDLEKAMVNPKAPAPKQASSGVGSSKSKYGQAVKHVDKSRYPKKPMNSLGETDKTWVIPSGATPQYAKETKAPEEKAGKPLAKEDEKTAPASGKTQAESHSLLGGKDSEPTSAEHAKIAELHEKAGNKKLADKHKKLSGRTPEHVEPEGAPAKKDPKEAKNVPMSEGDKAKNLIHNTKATDVKKKAKEVLNSAPSHQKEALKQIIVALEDHETIPHVPTPAEKAELKALSAAVDAVHKPIDQKRKETGKMHDQAAKEKQKANDAKKKQELAAATDKEKVRAKQKAQEDKKAEKEKSNKERDEKRLFVKTEREKEKATKEEAKIKAKKEEKLNKLKETLARDVKKPGSIEETAAHATHTAEAKELLENIDRLLDEHSDNPELVKLLERHRSVAVKHSELQRVPKKEDSAALKETKKVATGQQKTDDKAQKEQEKAQAQAPQEQQAQPSKPKPMNAYNTGRKEGEQVAHQATQDDGGSQVSGKAAGGLGDGVATAGHHLLSPEDSKKTVKNKKEVSQSSLGKSIVAELFKAYGVDSDTKRNLDTFDDTAQGLGTEEPSDEDEDVAKSLHTKLKDMLPRDFCSQKQFLDEQGYSSNTVIKGLKAVKYSEWMCDKMSKSVDELKKGLL